MALHEKIKIAQIIKDIHIYLLENNITTIKTKTDIDEKRAIITVTIDKDNTAILEDLTQNLECNRDVSLEEYAWEITIENNQTNELRQLGSLLDSFEIHQTEDDIELLFYRNCQ